MGLFYEMESIYSRIEKVIKDKGYVPYDFVLEPKEQTEDKIAFAPGALEGIIGHHCAGNGENDNAKRIAEFIQHQSNQEPIQTVMDYEEKWMEQETAVVRDALLREILNHTEIYDANNIGEVAYAMMTEGRHIETVKMGLTLMALFNMSENEDVKEKLLTLGKCEDFTEYVLMNISDWTEEEKNKVYFIFAQSLNGWGKINAVESLEANTEEIKEWILCEGCKNSILYSYLGLECAEKCDYLERLMAGHLTEQEKLGASDIMEGLLDEGPCLGISALKAPEETMYWYICAMEEKITEVKGIEQLFSMQDYLEEDIVLNEEGEESVNEWKLRTAEKIAQTLKTVDLETVVLESLADQTQCAINIAIKQNIDISQKLMELMQTEFEKYYYYGYYFLTRHVRGEEYIGICEKHLNYDTLPKGMGDMSGFGKKAHWSIDMVTQHLNAYPYCGQELLEASIYAPYIRWRNMAANALEAWRETLHKELQEISPKLYNAVLEIAKSECDEELKKRWNKLIQ